jgi:subtilisin family serine protease
LRNTKYVYLLIAILAMSWLAYSAASVSAANPSIYVEKAFPEGQWSRVIIHLKEKATPEIASKLESLSSFKLRYKVDNTPYIFNIGNFHAIAGEIYGSTGINELNSYANIVSAVYEDGEAHVYLDTSVNYIKAKNVWNVGYKGAGEVIAIIDTGIDASHQDLDQGKVIGWKDFVNGRTTPYDDHGHGTHCASTAAGTGEASGGKYTGVAPEASLVGVKVLDSSGSGTESNVIAGIQWCVDNKATYGIDVISMSLGIDRDCDGTCSVCQAADNAWDAGIFMAIAAGNSGSARMSIGCPGNAKKVVTVGAIDDSSGSIASWSSRGPTLDTRLKPDVCAPGVSITAAKANSGNQYTTMSGTSMATPHVAGAAALLIDAKGGSVAPYLVKGALISTAVDKGTTGPDIDYGWGIIDVYAAYQWIINPPAVSVKAAKIVKSNSISTGSTTDVSVQLWSIGTSAASSVYIDDTLDSHFSLSSGTLDVSVGTLAAGAMYKNTYTIKAGSTTGTYNLGQAYVTWSGGSTYTNNVSVTITSGGGGCLGTIAIALAPIIGFISLKLSKKRKK